MEGRSFALFYEHVGQVFADGQQLKQEVDDLDVKIDQAQQSIRTLQAQRKAAACRLHEVITEQNRLMDQCEALARPKHHNQSTSPNISTMKSTLEQTNIESEVIEDDASKATFIANLSKSGSTTASPTNSQTTFGAPEPTLHRLSAEPASPSGETYHTPTYGQETPSNKQTSKHVRDVEEEDQELLRSGECDTPGFRKRRRAAIAGERRLEEIQEMYPYRNKGSGKKRA